jgi:hypothetical protein
MTEPFNQYVGDGETVLYSFTFEYLEPSDIYVSVDTQLNTDWIQTSATEITFNTAPAIGSAINIFRSTDLDSMSAVFAAASTIRARDLNDDFNQLRLAIQEKLNSSTVINEGLPELIEENTDAISALDERVTTNETDIAALQAGGGGGGGYTLPKASATVLGGIKVGGGLAINSDGVLAATGGGGGGGAVNSVNGQQGDVLLTASDVGALPDTTTAADIGALPDTTPLNFIPLNDWSSLPQVTA